MLHVFALAAAFSFQTAIAKPTDPREVLVVSGMTQETKISTGMGIYTLKGGGGLPGDADQLRRELASLDASRFRAVISLGIAGGLKPSLKTGDLVIPSEVVFNGVSWPTDVNAAIDIVSRLKRLGIAVYAGRMAGEEVLTAIDPASKAKLRKKTGADLVDNESHIAAEWAAANKLPFAMVRVIDDAADESLPPAALVGLTPNGDVNYWAVLKSIVKDPAQIPLLIEEGFRTQKAYDALTKGRCGLDADNLAGSSANGANSPDAIWAAVVRKGSLKLKLDHGRVQQLVSGQEHCSDLAVEFKIGSCFVGYACPSPIM